jgi:hypothetical protein
MNKLSQFLALIPGLVAVAAFAQTTATEPAKASVEDSKGITIDEKGQFRGRSAPPAVKPSRKSDETAQETLVFSEAQKRIKTVVSQDLDLAYAYLSPASQLATPKMVYASKLMSRSLINATVLRVECESDALCKAVVNVASPVRLKGIAKPINHESVIEELWVKTDSGWKLVEGVK